MDEQVSIQLTSVNAVCRQVTLAAELTTATVASTPNGWVITLREPYPKSQSARPSRSSRLSAGSRLSHRSNQSSRGAAVRSHVAGGRTHVLARDHRRGFRHVLVSVERTSADVVVCERLALTAEPITAPVMTATLTRRLAGHLVAAVRNTCDVFNSSWISVFTVDLFSPDFVSVSVVVSTSTVRTSLSLVCASSSSWALSRCCRRFLRLEHPRLH